MVEAGNGTRDDEGQSESGEGQKQYRLARMQPKAARTGYAGALGLVGWDGASATGTGAWRFRVSATHRELFYRTTIFPGSASFGKRMANSKCAWPRAPHADRILAETCHRMHDRRSATEVTMDKKAPPKAATQA